MPEFEQRRTQVGAAQPPVQDLNVVQAKFRASVLEKLGSGEYWLETVDVCLCGSVESRRVADHDRFGLPVGVAVCAACGLARTSPRLAPECLPDFYESDYHGLHMGQPKPDPSMALFREGQGFAIFSRVADRLPRSFKVAEVGCGTGQVLREFEAAARAAGHAVSTLGCEYASEYVRAGHAVGTDIRLGGPSSLAAEAPFDLLILSHVVEHFADLSADLDAVGRLVHPDGLVYVEVPGILAIHRKPEYDYLFSRYFTLAHTFHFSLATLAYAMARGDLELLSGDEDARAVFRRSTKPVAVPTPHAGAEVLRYLAWLEASRLVRLRRIALKSKRLTRSMVSGFLRRALSPGAYGALRDVARRLRIAP